MTRRSLFTLFAATVAGVTARFQAPKPVPPPPLGFTIVTDVHQPRNRIDFVSMRKFNPTGYRNVQAYLRALDQIPDFTVEAP